MAKAYRANHNTRSFTSVATHEICHEMIRDKFGFLSSHKSQVAAGGIVNTLPRKVVP